MSLRYRPGGRSNLSIVILFLPKDNEYAMPWLRSHFQSGFDYLEKDERLIKESIAYYLQEQLSDKIFLIVLNANTHHR